MDLYNLGIIPLSIYSLSGAILGGLLLGFLYLKRLNTSTKDIVYHSFMVGEAFIAMMFIILYASRFRSDLEFLVSHLVGVTILWVAFILSGVLGAKGGE